MDNGQFIADVDETITMSSCLGSMYGEVVAGAKNHSAVYMYIPTRWCPIVS
jgi:hypothetical protein